MIDHVSLGTHNFERAADFYSAVLNVLGYQVHRRTEQEVAFGPPDAWLFFLYAEPAVNPVVGARMHVAFHSPDRASALAFHAAAIERGATSKREVAHRPEFGPDYFGGTFQDLDGHLIEVLTRDS